jgi:hypothetical protein
MMARAPDVDLMELENRPIVALRERRSQYSRPRLRSLWPRRRQLSRILPLLVYFTAFEDFGGYQAI